MTEQDNHRLRIARRRRDSLTSARFSDDTALLQAIRDDAELSKQLQRIEVLRRNTRIRTKLLSTAVQVNTNLIPNVADSLSRVAALLATSKPLEAYVFAEPRIHAFVAEARSRYLVALSSGAIDSLTAGELEFVIGHELGHVAFSHLEIPDEGVIELGSVNHHQERLLRAWQRAAEISADRVGLLCCDSLEVAATALFKTICGLKLPGVTIDPHEFASQWATLAEELLEHGARDHWQLSHPFPPLRMKALTSFWSRQDQSDSDRSIARMLAHMDSRGDSASRLHERDPLLTRFSFWGCLYVALADRPFNSNMASEFNELAPPGIQLHELLPESGSSPLASELCLTRFREARRTRREKLSSKELHALISEFVGVASRRGAPSGRSREHVAHLGHELGIGAGAVHLLIDKHTDRN